ncbi:MAG: ATP-binding cassette domain-containing protein [Desulfohalobiaceae bacterium]|nr:ATP-binding cassette domain-containing protein [Desulfohalobiaceae bacterium]
MKGVVLEVRGLSKEFAPAKGGAATTALNDVSLNVSAGPGTGPAGADGTGKTTLIRITPGLLKPSRGTVTVLGLDSVRESIRIQSRVGYMPQKFGLYEDLSVRENLDLYADLQGVPGAERRERYRRLLSMTSLTPFTERLAGALSGGMKQKLGLACSLVKSPQMLLLDEPTVGVDPVSRRELWKIVYELVEARNIGVLLSTPYLDEAERCDEVLVLHQGQKLDQGGRQKFQQQVRGRVLLVTPPPEVRPRQIQRYFAGEKKILDTTIRSGKIRVVTDGSGQEAIAGLLPSGWQPDIQQATPSFEDAFMAMIPGREGRFQPFEKTTSLGHSGPREKIMVRTRELSKSFGSFQAVKGLSFDVRQGEIFGLLGPNGAGKSTTFRVLCGLSPATSGEVSVAGKDLRRSRARARARLGYMAQQFSLYAQLTIRENLRFYGRVYGLSKKHLQQRIAWAFDEFGLGTWEDTVAAGLPGGYKQRLAMAAALLHEPDILFLDEPTSGVDPLARREFWLRINGFAEQGVTVVVTTHFMEESEYCDRMLIMSQGQSLALGTPGEIRSLVRTDDNPEPSIEDAFIALAKGEVKEVRSEE